MALRFYKSIRVLTLVCLIFILSLLVSERLVWQVEQDAARISADLLTVKPRLLPLPANDSPHRLAVLVPFRERFTELQLFLPHLHRFLSQQQVEHTFYVINQVDDYRFNRGALLNIGAIESALAETDCVYLNFSESSNRITSRYCFPPTDYLALHDVDMLPQDSGLRYTYPHNGGPHHLIPASLHPRYYWYKRYFGGVVLLSRARFNSVNGFSNSFWGWGREDDEFRLRILRANLTISTPSKTTSGKNAFHFIHNEVSHRRDMHTYNRPDVKRLFRELSGGLDNVNYTVHSRRLLTVDSVPALVFNVHLSCNYSSVICYPIAQSSSNVSINGITESQ